MVEFRFRATPGYPRHLHRKGGRRAEPLRGGKNALLVEPEWLEDGDTVDLVGSDVSWALSNLPENFVKVEKTPKTPKPKLLGDSE